jgi:hypothetical protein
MTVVVTSFDEPQWDLYARRCLESHHALWPPDWSLTAYTSMPALLEANPFQDRLFRFLPLPESISIFKSMAPKGANGTKPYPCWSSRDLKKGHSYRTDALRFCYKPLVLVEHATQLTRAEGPLTPHTFFWLDADVVTLTAPPDDALEQMLPDEAGICRLHRPKSYSETGFLGFRLPAARSFFRKLADIYLTGSLYRLSQWHDSWAIDFAIRSATTLLCHNHNGSWPFGWSDHLKGKRKELSVVYGPG